MLFSDSPNFKPQFFSHDVKRGSIHHYFGIETYFFLQKSSCSQIGCVEFILSDPFSAELSYSHIILFIFLLFTNHLSP